MPNSLLARPAGAWLLIASLLVPSRVEATWSILIADRRTKEIGYAIVTCVEGDDLSTASPVILTEVGAGTVQAYSDFEGLRMPIIRRELLNGTPPEEILRLLRGITGHESRQYGIVDVLDRGATETGGSADIWPHSGGIVGRAGDWVYAVQGNSLAGPCVLEAAAAALAAVQGDMSERLIVALDAARAVGGDGRCSCRAARDGTTSCGCPVASFRKSAHNGFLVVARAGDRDDPLCDSACADGDYFLKLNVNGQVLADADPVQQLHEAFDAWRSELAGKPDAVRSTTAVVQVEDAYELRIELRDWRDIPIPDDGVTVSVSHSPRGAGILVIGAVQPLGGGAFTVRLDPDGRMGLDILRVLVEMPGERPVVLMPSPTICLAATGPGGSLDCNANSVPDVCEAGVTSLDVNRDGVPDECEADCNGNAMPDAWETQVKVSPDCNTNGMPDSCDLASGDSGDCNRNGIPDECDLRNPFVGQDCDSNGILDSCEIANGSAKDCNLNRRPDACEIASGSVPDCNRNGVPDLCDIAEGTSLDDDADVIPDECEKTPIHRADPNSSGTTDLSDAVFIFSYLFLGGTAPECIESADANNDGKLDLSDGIYVLSWLFTGGPEPPEPGAADRPCGVDPDPAGSAGDLGCSAYAPCR